jgi:hypothetical protein
MPRKIIKHVFKSVISSSDDDDQDDNYVEERKAIPKQNNYRKKIVEDEDDDDEDDDDSEDEMSWKSHKPIAVEKKYKEKHVEIIDKHPVKNKLKNDDDDSDI